MSARSTPALVWCSSLADENPDALELVEDIGPVCDAWIVFGTRPVDEGRTIVWTESPASSLYGVVGR